MTILLKVKAAVRYDAGTILRDVKHSRRDVQKASCSSFRQSPGHAASRLNERTQEKKRLQLLSGSPRPERDGARLNDSSR